MTRTGMRTRSGALLAVAMACVLTVTSCGATTQPSVTDDDRRDRSTRRSRAPPRALSAWSPPATSPASRVRGRARGSVGTPPRPTLAARMRPHARTPPGRHAVRAGHLASVPALLRPQLGQAALPDSPDHRQPRVRDTGARGLLLVLLEPPARSARLLPHDGRELGGLPPEQQLRHGQLRHPGDVARPSRWPRGQRRARW